MASHHWRRVTKGSFSESFSKFGTYLQPSDAMEGADSFHSEEDLLNTGETDSFWDIGNYKRVVKRMEEGARLCGDFIKMAQERAELEAKYVKHLNHWSKKWEDLVSRGPEYGSLEMGWKAALSEATKLAEVHDQIHHKIQNDIIDSVQEWKSQHYHKQLMHFKECKKADDGFTRAQKPWAKRLSKNRKAKKMFHTAARDLEMQTISLQQIENSREVTSEQVGKGREKKERAQRELDKALEKYKERLGDVQHYRSRYIEDMTTQFQKCQDFESKRMEFFRTMLQSFKTALDLSQDQRLADIYTTYGETLSRMNTEDDLRWYSTNYGVDMPYSWPEFEQYVPGQFMKSGTLRAPIARNESPMLNGGSERKAISNGSRNISHDDSFDNMDGGWIDPPPDEEVDGLEDGNLADEETGGSSVGTRSSSEEPQGRLMRAMYDYGGSEDDDLHFKEGDLVRVMYEGEDGWAEGLMGDHYGYVPISYLEPV